MWLFLGISAIIFTGFNLICSFKSKNEKWFRFGAISFTALTVCSFYSDGAMRVLNEDWGGLMDNIRSPRSESGISYIGSNAQSLVDRGASSIRVWTPAGHKLVVLHDKGTCRILSP